MTADRSPLTYEEALRQQVPGMPLCAQPEAIKMALLHHRTSLTECRYNEHRVAQRAALEARFATLATVKDGWWEGEGLAPSTDVLARAREALLAAMDAGAPRPSVFPTFNGCVQAEWMSRGWAVDIRFRRGRGARASGVGPDRQHREAILSAADPSELGREITAFLHGLPPPPFGGFPPLPPTAPPAPPQPDPET